MRINLKNYLIFASVTAISATFSHSAAADSLLGKTIEMDYTYLSGPAHGMKFNTLAYISNNGKVYSYGSNANGEIHPLGKWIPNERSPNMRNRYTISGN